MRYFIKFGLISFFLIGIVSCHKALPVPEPQPQYDPRNISRTDSTQSAGPWVAIGPDGTVYVAWMDGSRTGYEPFRIYFRYKTPGGNWSDIEILSDSLHDAWGPHIAADPSGNVHLVWDANTIGNNDFKVYYRMRYPSGEWSETRVLSGDEQADQPRIAVDSSGAVHVIWCEGVRMRYRRKTANGSWSDAEISPYYILNPSFAADSKGGLHIVSEGERDLYYIYRSPTGEWSRINVTNSNHKSWYGYLFLDEKDQPWIFWTEQDYRAGWNTGIIYYTHEENGHWTEPDTIPGTVGWPRHKYTAFKNGELLLAWVDGRGRSDIPVQYIVMKNGKWGTVEKMDFPLWAWTLSGAVNPFNEEVHLVWESEVLIDDTLSQFDIFHDIIGF